MPLAAIDDFTVKDLSAPTAPRVRHVLSGLINFAHFEQEQAVEFLGPLQEEQDDQALLLADLSEQIARTRQQLTFETESLAERQTRADELKREYLEKMPELESKRAEGKRDEDWIKNTRTAERAKTEADGVSPPPPRARVSLASR